MIGKESPNLDLLRSVAVLAVLTDHITATHGLAQKHRFLFTLGYWGVLLFFVHTSFVLMMSLERLGLKGRQLYTTFYVRRFFRIYPLSVVTVILALMFHIPHRSWDSAYCYFGLKTTIANFLLCQNLLTFSQSVIGPMWSLPFEIQMYVLLPVLFTIMRRIRSSTALSGFWLCGIAIGLLQPWAASKDLGQTLRLDRLGIAEYIPCFLAGVTAYYITMGRSDAKLRLWIWPSSLAVITLVYLRWQVTVDEKPWLGWCCCLAVGLVVAHCRECSLERLNRFTHYVAKYSYGLYLGQVPVLWLTFVKLHDLPKALQWFTFLVLIILVPIASYHLIEEPLIRFGAGLSSPASRASVVANILEPAGN